MIETKIMGWRIRKKKNGKPEKNLYLVPENVDPESC